MVNLFYDSDFTDDDFGDTDHLNKFGADKFSIKLLKDDKLRLKCVAELNNAIEKNGRWSVRFASLEKFLGIKLLKIKNACPELIFINSAVSAQQPRTVIENTKTHKPFLHSLRLKNRCALVYLLVLGVFAQIPVLDLTMRSQKRISLLQKIQKWWR